MAVKKMGFEGKAYYGVAGSTAATELTNSRDIKYGFDTSTGETTIRGDGSAVPIQTERVTKRIVSIEWTMIYKSDDTALEALLVASFAGTPVALRTKSYSSGKGYDGDVNLKHSHGKPLDGEQTIDFTATPNDDSRTPSLYI